jgi:hypothetical protein
MHRYKNDDSVLADMDYVGLVNKTNYHPIVKEMMIEQLKKVVPAPEKVKAPQHQVYKFKKGDWTYTIGWSVSKITVENDKVIYDRDTNTREVVTEPRKIRIQQAVMICTHSNGHQSMRRLTAIPRRIKVRGKFKIQLKKTFTDCRQGGLGSGLDKHQLAKTLPGKLTKRERTLLVSWLIFAHSQIRS